MYRLWGDKTWTCEGIGLMLLCCGVWSCRARGIRLTGGNLLSHSQATDGLASMHGNPYQL